MLGIALSRCESDNPNMQGLEDIRLTEITFTGCNLTLKSPADKSPSLILTGSLNGMLKINAINTEFCCGTDSISILKTINSGEIILEIIDEGPFTHCFCEHDAEFTLGPLDVKPYKITFIESAHAYTRDTFTTTIHFSEHLDTTILPNTNTGNAIKHTSTVPGGCNNMDFSGIKSTTTENDTVLYRFHNDTLNISVGLNYICCAPFETGTMVYDDTIHIMINDTCDLETENCYCRCNCYYTWDFIFTGYEQNPYFYLIELTKPGETEPSTISTGIIDSK